MYIPTFKKKKKKILYRQKIFIIKAGYIRVFYAIIPHQFPLPFPLTNIQASNLYTSACSSDHMRGVYYQRSK